MLVFPCIHKKEEQMQHLRRKQVEQITGLSRSSIYAMMAEGRFPKQRKIGRRAVAWLKDDIDNWINDCSN
jgi:prophage regulatory protein